MSAILDSSLPHLVWEMVIFLSIIIWELAQTTAPQTKNFVCRDPFYKHWRATPIYSQPMIPGQTTEAKSRDKSALYDQNHGPLV